MKSRKRKYVFGGIVILIAMLVLIVNGLTSCAMDTYTVGELMDEGEAVYGDEIRLDGMVVEGSVVEDGMSLTFMMTGEEGMRTVPVKYEGAKPDGFQEGRGVSVEGEYMPEGHFAADRILTKCPSKYVPEE